MQNPVPALMKKTLYGLLIIVSILGVLGLSSCQGGGDSGVTDTYYNQDNSEERLELREDGTFYLYEYGVEFTGEWQIEGDTLTLTFADMPSDVPVTVDAILQGDTIRDDEGKTWVKE